MEQACLPGGLLRPEQAVLVVIDVQERLLPVIAERERVVANIRKLVRFAGIIGLPVIVTEQVKLGPTVEEIRCVLPDAAAIEKSAFSCFGCEEFVAAAGRLGRGTLILTGIEAHICVTQTALRALPHYGVHAVSDAMSSRSLHNWEIALGRMRQAGATITSTEMVMYELLEKAGTEEFRAVLQLVKEG
jgi:isochorismate hydrolase